MQNNKTPNKLIAHGRNAFINSAPAVNRVHSFELHAPFDPSPTRHRDAEGRTPAAPMGYSEPGEVEYRSRIEANGVGVKYEDLARGCASARNGEEHDELRALTEKLHLGCGRNYIPGWVNVDCVSNIGADIVHDLNSTPWPLPSNHFAEVEMVAVLEHLKDTLAMLGELHRVMKPGGRAHIHVPYCPSVGAFQDPTHCAYFNERTLNYVRDGFDCNFYTNVRFEILSSKLTTGSNSLTAKLRNLIPFRPLLRWFLWNMYDGVDFIIRKP